MNKYALIGIVLLAGALGAGTGDLISHRLSVTNTADKPVVILQADKDGDGELVVMDAKGQELFAIRKGQIQNLHFDAATINSGPRIMQIESVELRPKDDSNADQIAELRAQAIDKDKQADKLEDERRHIDLNTGAYESKETRGATRNEARRRWQQLGEDIVQLRAEADRLRGNAKRLERDAAEPRQLIRGWNGRQSIVLQTDSDFSRALSDIVRGSFVAWEGSIMEQDSSTQIWNITRVYEVDAPNGFVLRTVKP